MASERLKRQIDSLLDEVEAAVSALDWDVVRDRTKAVLALDPENGDALTYLAAAERSLDGPDDPQPSQPDIAPEVSVAAASTEKPRSFANGRYEVRRFI